MTTTTDDGGTLRIVVIGAATFFGIGGFLLLVWGRHLGVSAWAAGFLLLLAALIVGGYVQRHQIDTWLRSRNGPGRFAVTGVDKATGKEGAKLYEASTPDNAKAMAEREGMTVTRVRRA